MDHFDIAIIGTGSGNTILDERYADRRIAICEQGVFGGTCLNVGCIPTKMFVYAADIAQFARESPRFGVDAHVDGVRWNDIVSRVFGRIDPLVSERRAISAFLAQRRGVHQPHGSPRPCENGRYRLRTDDGDEFTADQVVIAAGARATVPDAIARCGVQYHTSNTIMRIAKLPEHLVIVGGGFIATEFAHIFSELGSRVTLVIRGGTLLRQCDDTVCERFTDIAGKKWNIRSHRNVVGGRQDKSGITLQLDDGSRLQADTLLVSTGRIPNGDLLNAELAGVEVIDGLVSVDEYQRTTARGIYALGDVSSPYQLKHVANHEARVVKNNLLADWDDTDTLMRANHRYVPSAVFTDRRSRWSGQPKTKPAHKVTTSSRRCKITQTSPTDGRWKTRPASPKSSSTMTPG